MEKYDFFDALDASEDEILRFKNAFIAHNESFINGSCGLMRHDDPKSWLSYIARVSSGEEPGRSRSSVLFMKRRADNKIVGIMDVRRELSPGQWQNGHIGLSIAPDERNKGLAKLALDQGFEILRKLGLTEAAVVCDEDNFPSKRAIEGSGLEFEHKYVEDCGNVILIYTKKL